jgi:uncharacterized membrane protein YkvA (DUF1232 family)
MRGGGWGLVRPVNLSQRLRARARDLKAQTLALYLACRDTRTPWYAKALGIVIVGYALSPIDLIPDFIPILGYLDDLILIPLGIALVRRMIPPAVMEDARREVATRFSGGGPRSRVAAAVVVAVWLALLALIVRPVVRTLRGL